MKKYIILGLLLSGLQISFTYAQDYKAERVKKNTEYLAKKIAKNLHDSLKLTVEEYNAIYEANIKIQNQKIFIMGLTIGRDSIGIQLQKIENKRDSIYAKILPKVKLELYITKKRHYLNYSELNK